MNEKASRFIAPVVLGTSLALASFGSASAQEEGPSAEHSPSASPTANLDIQKLINSDSDTWRVVTMGTAAFYICFTDIEPELFMIPTEEYPQGDPGGNVEFIGVEKADCGVLFPSGEVVIYQNTTRDIFVGGSFEVADLEFARSQGIADPPIFADIPDLTVVYE